MGRNTMVSLHMRLERETDAAVKVSNAVANSKAGTFEVWLPKSQIECERNMTPGSTYDFLVPEWLVDKHGLT